MTKDEIDNLKWLHNGNMSKVKLDILFAYSSKLFKEIRSVDPVVANTFSKKFDTVGTSRKVLTKLIRDMRKWLGK